MINKRYKDIFNQYIHKGEATPLSIGTLVVCALCFLILIVATFTQINFTHPWFKFVPGAGFSSFSQVVSYSPLLPAMIFIIYILGAFPDKNHNRSAIAARIFSAISSREYGSVMPSPAHSTTVQPHFPAT